MAHYTRYGKVTPSLRSEVLVPKPKVVFCIVTKMMYHHNPVFATALRFELVPLCPLSSGVLFSQPNCESSSWLSPGKDF